MSCGMCCEHSRQEVQGLGKDPAKEQVCPSLEEAQQQERFLEINENGEGKPFHFGQPVGIYYVCLLDDAADAVTGVPLRSAWRALEETSTNSCAR